MCKQLRCQGPRALAVVVLYQVDEKNSVCLKSLFASRERAGSTESSLQILVYDNSPSKDKSSRPRGDGVWFESYGVNKGTSVAYNRALELAIEGGFDWIMLLDQDTELPADFVEKAFKEMECYAEQGSVAAIAPVVRCNGIIRSPSLPVKVRTRYLPVASCGIQEKEIICICSGTIVRRSFVASLGGFNESFWLDYLDYWLCHQIYANGKKIAIMPSVVEHDLSVSDRRAQISKSRYSSILAGEVAFTTTYKSLSARLYLMARLAIRSIRFALEGNRDLSWISIRYFAEIIMHPARVFEAAEMWKSMGGVEAS